LRVHLRITDMRDQTVSQLQQPPPMLARVRKRAAVSVVLIGALLAACGTVKQSVTATRSNSNGAVTSAPGDTGPTDTGTTPDTGVNPTDTGPGNTTQDTGTNPTDTNPTGTSSADTLPGTPGGTAPEDTTFDTKPTETTITVPAGQKIIDFGSSKTPEPYDGFLVSVFQDIEKFWTEQMPATYGKPFVPLKGGIFAAYKSRREPIPGCGTARTSYSDVEGNAFYCSQGDFIVYDDDELMPQLVQQLGQSAVGVVLAHEFGHAIQERNGDFAQPTILKEQQADCFAGAWAAHLSRGESPGLVFGDKEIKAGLIAMIQVRDPVDGNVKDADAHGTGFDRVGAFEDGFTGGTMRCKTFFTEDRQKSLIDIPFDANDPTGGNLPFDDPSATLDIVRAIPADLDRFWTVKINGVAGVTFTAPKLDLYAESGPYPACKGATDNDFKKNIFFCPSANEIMVDQDLGAQLDADPVFGDMSVGYLIGESYSEAIQRALGSTLTGKKRVLLNDCFTGAWVADDIPPLPAPRDEDPTAISLSAGDLDEAIITALSRSDNTSDENVRGTAFEKIDSFRKGVLGGIDACQKTVG
jgi:predicted metalloprotease